MDDGNMVGKFPAVVKTYDQARRTCRVEIPAINTGGDVFPEAEIEYSIGDKSRSGIWETEIEILPNDTVWVEFIGGDPRYPIITGWRNPQTGNSKDWRRWHHKNAELNTDEHTIIHAGKTIMIDAGEKITLKVGGSTIVITGDSIKLKSARIDFN